MFLFSNLTKISEGDDEKQEIKLVWPYFDAASLTGALLAASFLGACDEQLQLASSGNQFSKIRRQSST